MRVEIVKKILVGLLGLGLLFGSTLVDAGQLNFPYMPLSGGTLTGSLKSTKLCTSPGYTRLTPNYCYNKHPGDAILSASSGCVSSSSAFSSLLYQLSDAKAIEVEWVVVVSAQNVVNSFDQAYITIYDPSDTTCLVKTTAQVFYGVYEFTAEISSTSIGRTVIHTLIPTDSLGNFYYTATITAGTKAYGYVVGYYD